MAPRPLSQLLHILPHAWVPFLHSHIRVHAHTHITHLAGHTVTTLGDRSKESGLGSAGTRVALSVSE